jgi:hypothetical protein
MNGIKILCLSSRDGKNLEPARSFVFPLEGRKRTPQNTGYTDPPASIYSDSGFTSAGAKLTLSPQSFKGLPSNWLLFFSRLISRKYLQWLRSQLRFEIR